MDLLFCDNPFDPRPGVEPDFEAEFAVAKQAGFFNHLLSYEALTKDQDAVLATRRIPQSETLESILYRGWMLKPDYYAALYEALLAKNYKLINTPAAYLNCHYLPHSYRFIQDHTPKTVWMPVVPGHVDYDHVFAQLSCFDDSPLIVKDFVKSQKHYWDSACFIPSAADRNQVKAVVDKFLALQGEDLNEGLVFRKFVPLKDLAIHSKSGMPLKEEYRLFFFEGRLLGCYDYWEEGEYADIQPPPLGAFTDLAQGVESRFFSMDIARTTAGRWIIVELGDGQVAGLPESADKAEFYTLLRRYSKQ